MTTHYTSFFTTGYSLEEFDGPTAAVEDEDILDNLYIPGPLFEVSHSLWSVQ